MVKYETITTNAEIVKEISCDMCGMRVIVDEHFSNDLESAIDYYEFLHIETK